jgi:hypothetical protein
MYRISLILIEIVSKAKIIDISQQRFFLLLPKRKYARAT